MQIASPAEVADIGRCQRLLPGEAQFKGKKGYWRKYRKDGSGRYEWGFKFRPNVNGKRTKAQSAVLEMMQPFITADSQRHAALQKQSPKASLRDADGAVRVVDATLADSTAERNGWSHSLRIGKNRSERGVDGMLFVSCGGTGWYPTGRWCAGIPFTMTSRPKGGRRDGTMPRTGIQRDPDGHPWRYIEGEWRRTG